MENSNPQQDFVLKTIKSRDVHFVRCWFSDVLGNMKSFAMVPGEVECAFSEGMGFDGSCIEGFSKQQISDMLAFPDPSTFQVLPWRPQANAVARMFCDIRTPDGKPFDGDPRYVLAKQMQKASEAGYEFNVGPELEFFYFQDANSTQPLDQGSYFDLTSLDSASDLRRDTVLTLEHMGIPVEYSHHEVAPSQHEIDLRYTDAMSMADAVMTYKLVVKEIALKHGVHATFMPKPLVGKSGNSMHVHQSLSNLEGKNAFYDSEDDSGMCLSRIAKHYIAGLIKYAPEFCLLTNQYVNSYKRLRTGEHMPVCLGWSHNSRCTLVRIPGYRPNVPDACRVELRNPDPSANPYLAFAAMLAAGLKGIEDELPLDLPMEDTSLGEMNKEQLNEKGVNILPENLGEAVEVFEKSELMKETLGEHIHSYLVSAKRAEWRSYQSEVTPWELEHYLAVL